MSELSEQLKFESFSGVDVTVVANVSGDPKVPAFVMANIQTLTVSTHRDTSPVRSIGFDRPTAYVQGTRTVSGTMVFTKVHRADMDEMMQQSSVAGIGDSRGVPSADRVPKFNINIHKATEYSDYSDSAKLIDVTIMSGGHTISIHDVYTEQVYNYVAVEYIDFGAKDLENEVDPVTRLSDFYEALGVDKE